MDNKMIIQRKEQATIGNGMPATIDVIREIKPGDAVVFNRDGIFIEGTVQHIGDMGTAAIVVPFLPGFDHPSTKPVLKKGLPIWVHISEIVEVSAMKTGDFCTDEQKPN